MWPSGPFTYWVGGCIFARSKLLVRLYPTSSERASQTRRASLATPLRDPYRARREDADLIDALRPVLAASVANLAFVAAWIWPAAVVRRRRTVLATFVVIALARQRGESKRAVASR